MKFSTISPKETRQWESLPKDELFKYEEHVRNTIDGIKSMRWIAHQPIFNNSNLKEISDEADIIADFFYSSDKYIQFFEERLKLIEYLTYNRKMDITKISK